MNASIPNLDKLTDAQKRALLLDMMRAQKAKGKEIPLSNGQMRFWMLDQMDRESATYNLLPYGLHIEGHLNVPAFKQAIQHIYQNHDILRTTFSEGTTGPRQMVSVTGALPIRWIDLEESHPDDSPHAQRIRQAAIKKVQIEETKRIFDLGKGPLIHVSLIRFSEVEHVLLLTMHHIIADAWSIAVIMRELEKHYAALQKDPQASLPKPPKQYADFVTWEKERLSSGLLEKQLTFWQEKLSNLPPLLELPNDRPRPLVQSHQSAEEDFALSSEVSQGLRVLCREHGVSLTLVLVAAFKLLLAKYSGRSDIAIGQAVSNRNQADWEKLIGFFVNTVVLRSQLDDADSFVTHLLKVKHNLLQAYEHKDAPFDKVVQRLGQDRSLAFSPLFQVLFALVDARTLLRLPELTITPLREIRTRIQFDLHLLMWEEPQGIRGTLEFNTDIFDRTTSQRMLEAFSALLRQIAGTPNAALSQFELLEPQTKQTYIQAWNATQHAYTPWQSIHQIIEEQVGYYAPQTALIFRDQKLSYGEFNQAANRIAHYVLGLKLPPNSLIGVCLDRSAALCSSLLGILKAGCCYLPLDPNHPQQRLAFQIADAAPQLVITQRRLAEKFSEAILLIEDPVLQRQTETNPEIRVIPQQAAYVIYTSGSTGQPKGTVISHQAIANRLLWMQKQFRMGPEDRLLQKTPYSFDVSLWELFWPFMTGAQLVIAEPGRHWDTGYLKTIMETHQISCLHFVPSMLALFLNEPGIEKLQHLKYVICSGEALSTDLFKRFKAKLACALFNLYGPTEAAVDVSYAEATQGHTTATVPIGKPIDNTQLYVANRYLHLLPQGVGGELLIGGIQLASGYLARPALTAQRFIPDPFGKEPGARLYRSGDFVRHLHGGAIEYLSRIDHQVKVRGFRIELGEIETAICALPIFREACVVVQSQANGHDRLIAYVVRTDGSTNLESAWREALAQSLPEYMLPSMFILLAALPLSANGKVDRQQLPLPGKEPVAQKRSYEAPRTPLEKQLTQLWAELLGIEKVGIHDRFFELGGHSYLLIQMHRQLCQRLSQNLTLVELFQHPTIAQLANHLQKSNAVSPSENPLQNSKVFEDGIAIIGMAGRFPGANSTTELWGNLINGVESISFFDDETLIEEGVSPQEFRAESYVPAAGVLDHISDFDANFFGFTPREAEITDPQQRLFIECAYEALESAGHSSDHFDGRIGVFAGTGMSTYFLSNLLSQPGVLKSAELYQIMVGNDRNFPATQTSHKLNLGGPSINVANACSSSLIAVHMACKSLLEGESDMALAGGMKVMVPHRVGYHYQEGNIHSPDGHCRTFDASAKGIVMSSGGGLVVLRRLQDALADGDQILAVIKGSAINNDGADKVGFMAPGARGQEEVIASAHQAAQIDPATISYVEAHGTGTTLGDPIEMAALTAAFRRKTQAKNYCDIGSIKTNMGHLDHAAGIAGLIKTVLAMGHRQIPPSLHFKEHNPGIDFENSPFRVVAEAKNWASDGPLRAGVSSFGIGGTNAHLVLEEAPERPAKTPENTHPQLWVVAAKTATARHEKGEQLSQFFRQRQPHPAAMAFTLQLGRKAYPYRQYLIWDPQQPSQVEQGESWTWVQGYASGQTPDPIFLFPGQGAQHPHMLKDLYAAEPVFRQWVNTCADILQPILKADLRHILYPTQDVEAAQGLLNQTQFTQPALFTVSFAAAKMLDAWGIRPKAMMGHSIGEYVAACLAGVFSLEDALVIVAKRGALMQSMQPGAMLAIGKSLEDIRPFLDGRYDLAAVNAPEQCVIAGSLKDIESLREALGTGRLLNTSHAFHSQSMEPALESFGKAFESITLAPPNTPLIANLTGQWLQDEQACDPQYWITQLRNTVLFADGMSVLLQQPNALLIEVGPGQTLTRLAKACAKEDAIAAFALARHPKQQIHDVTQAYHLLGQLWLRGFAPHWQALHSTQIPTRIALPTYPFERKRFWVDPGESMTPATSLARKSKSSDWFFLPSWQQQSPRIFKKPLRLDPEVQWLILATKKKHISDLENLLLSQVNQSLCLDQNAAHALPNTEEDFTKLFGKFQSTKPLNIIDLTALEPAETSDPVATYVIRPLHALKALVKGGFDSQIHWAFVTSETFQVVGAETVHPYGALYSGPVKVFGQEFGHIRCSLIDVDAALLKAPHHFAEQLLHEMHAKLPHSLVAHRGHLRWAPTYVPDTLEPETHSNPTNTTKVYLITGGLGGIGYTFAQHFAQQPKVTLILTGRKALASEHPRQLVPQTDASQPTLAQKIERLEASGAQVLYRAVDVCEAQAMAKLFEEVENKYSHMDGMIHTAGIAGGGLSLLKTEDSARKVLNPKVMGTHHFAEGIRRLKPSFSMFCSSTTAILGGIGQVDYCAANSFQDAMAVALSEELQRPVLSINWPAWQQVGMAVETQVPEAWRAAHEHNIAMGISPQEGVEALKRILSSGLNRVVVSTVDMNQAIIALEQLTQIPTEELLGQTSKRRHERPPLPTPFEAPRDDIETKLAEIWSTFLGIDAIGIHDDFFALGGHSLLATQIVGKIRHHFDIELQLHALFDNPTIASLVLVVIQAKAELGSQEELEALLQEVEAMSEDTFEEQASS